MKTALVTGISGQDGAYLAKELLSNGYKVYGGLRRTSNYNLWRLDRLGIKNEIEFVDFELLEQSNISKTIKNLKPTEVYNLAAQSFVGVSFNQPVYTAHASGLSVLSIVEAIRENSPETKFYQASTSEMFGKVAEIPQSEKTPFHPRSPYGVAKLFGHWTTKNYRESYNMFCSSGILFNHESPLRGEEFVTRKITKGLVDIKQGKLTSLKLGNIDAKRDWGFAGDFCNGIYKILQHNQPDDFVLATGETHTIKEFIIEACKALDLSIDFIGADIDLKVIDTKTNKIIIEIDPKFFRPCEVDLLIGDPSKAKELLGWKPTMNFNKLVQHMVEEELR